MLNRQDVSKRLCENLKRASEYPIDSKECLNAIEQCIFLVDYIAEIENNLKRTLDIKNLQFQDYFYRKLQDNLIQRVRIIEQQSSEHHGKQETALIQLLRILGANIENCDDSKKIEQIRHKFTQTMRGIIYRRYLDVFNNRRYGTEPEPFIDVENDHVKRQKPLSNTFLKLTLDTLLEKEIQNKKLKLAKALVKYIKEDPNNILKGCYPNPEKIKSNYDVRICNCQVILEMYLIRLPHLNVRQIGEELGGIHRQTIERRLTICQKIIDEIAKEISNKLDELENQDSHGLPLITYESIFQEIKIEGISLIIQKEI